MIDNWDEGIQDSDEYAWAFARPSPQTPVKAIKTSKSSNIKAKQTTTLMGLKGKMVRKQRDGVQPDMVPVPKHAQDHYQRIILVIDIMYVNQIPFLIRTSRHIHYHTASVLPSMNWGIIVSALWALYRFYRKRDF